MATSLTVMLLTMSSIALRRQMAHNSYVNGPAPANGTSYDYIIVGGGSAGCVLAGRLAAAPNVTVLLLEAGGPQSVITDMPGNTLYLVGGEFDWNYHVVPQTNAGLAYPDFFISRGRVLGGSSTTNWDIYNRGNPADYNNWATSYGLTNMSWPNVLEYFLLSENNTDSGIRANGLHGMAGPVAVSTETEPDPVLSSFMRTMNAVGMPTIDINGPSQMGTAIAQMFWNLAALKSTTANAYIENANRTNLSIVTRAFVTGILMGMGGMGGGSSRAAGVQYRNKNGTTMVAFANQEVIISAGPINTPQILMLSGIGPIAHLNQLGIPVVRNLPVGNNLHDMVFVPLYYRINDQSQIDAFPRFEVDNLYHYFAHGLGPLAHHPDGLTYYRSSRNPNATWPDTMIISVVEFFNDLNATVGQYISNQNEWRAYWEPYATLGYYLAIDPVLARPRSRGTVRLNLTNPTGPPLVDPQYLSNNDDFEALLDAVRFSVRSIQNYPLPYVTQFPPIPGCPPCKVYCEEYLRCHVRQLARSYYNFVGTARMGIAGDINAVVDPTFRVMGFDNLRVVDASVIPEIPNAHTNAATIMLAEKAARLIMTGQ